MAVFSKVFCKPLYTIGPIVYTSLWKCNDNVLRTFAAGSKVRQPAVSMTLLHAKILSKFRHRVKKKEAHRPLERPFLTKGTVQYVRHYMHSRKQQTKKSVEKQGLSMLWDKCISNWILMFCRAPCWRDPECSTIPESEPPSDLRVICFCSTGNKEWMDIIHCSGIKTHNKTHND